MDGRVAQLVELCPFNPLQASVFNVEKKSWIAPSEPVDDIGQGKERAAEYARAYLKHAANSDLPPLKWEKSRSR